MQAIKQEFDSFDKMKEMISTSTVAVQGSGWGWLGYNRNTHKLQIATCPNQDPLEATTGKFVENYLHLIILSSFLSNDVCQRW